MNATATMLRSGRVLVAGGYDGSTYLATTEIFDAGTTTWRAGPSMITRREFHTATLLPKGRVLVAGGYGGTYGNVLNDAELFVP